MKYLFTFFAAIAIANAIHAQTIKSDIPPYQRDSMMPDFKLLREDSSWLLTKKLPVEQPVIFIFFNPGCSNCQHEADSLVKYMGEMKNANFIFTTIGSTFKVIDSFATVHGLAEFKNVHFVRDPNYQFDYFFRMSIYPFVALYKNGKLAKAWTAEAPPNEIIQCLNE
jgi:thiol-disulfide isomerase/thioredoxin